MKIHFVNFEGVDAEYFLYGEGYCHATPFGNLYFPLDVNSADHEFGDLAGGIFANNLKPLILADKKSSKPITRLWALPWEQ